MGYLNKDSDTKDCMTEENWLSLGDLGYIDDDDFLVVFGRPKNFIKLKNGELVFPQKVKCREN